MPLSNKFKHFIFIIVAISVGIFAASLIYKGGGELLAYVKASIPQPEPAPAPIEVKVIPPPPPAEITIDFVGDIILDRSVKKSVENNFSGDWNKLFENVNDLKNADIAFANLEGPVSMSGKKMGSIYSFRFSPESLEAVTGAGFDILNIANNHIGDWGPMAFADTLDAITSDGIKYTGGGWNKSEARNPTVIEKNGIKVGFLGFSDVGPTWMKAGDNTPGIMLASDPDIDTIIKDASKRVDILVVSFHFGEEYKKYTKRQENIAHSAINAGAKIVIGAHPHVIQDTEEYNGGLIAYSLGNFIFDQKFSKETMQGMLLETTFSKTGLKSYNKKLIKLNDQFQPQYPVDFTQQKTAIN